MSQCCTMCMIVSPIAAFNSCMFENRVKINKPTRNSLMPKMKKKRKAVSTE